MHTWTCTQVHITWKHKGTHRPRMYACGHVCAYTSHKGTHVDMLEHICTLHTRGMHTIRITLGDTQEHTENTLTHVYTRTQTCVYTQHTCEHKATHMDMLAHTWTHMHTGTHVDTHGHTGTRGHVHAHGHACTCTSHMHTGTHMDTDTAPIGHRCICTHARTHAECTHTVVYTHI